MTLRHLFSKRDREEDSKGPLDLGPKVLWDGGGPSHATLDVVFVHGLRGHRIKTWQYDDKLWMRDFLPSRLPSARIITWGYDSSVAKFRESASQDTIFGHAQSLATDLVRLRRKDCKKGRPIIFVGHSLGGLVIKDALLRSRERFDAQNDADVGTIYTNTKGLVFLGTPHRGSPQAQLGNIVALIAEATVMRGSNDLVRALKQRSDILEHQRASFALIADKFHIANIYEERPTEFGMIVPKDSAILDIKGEETIGIPANHMRMCKFPDDDNIGYLRVSDFILSVAEKICHDAERARELARKEKLQEILRSLHFPEMDDREYDIENAHAKTFRWLLDQNDTNSPLLQWVRDRSETRTPFWISGKAASGKSTLMKFLHNDIRLARNLLFWKPIDQLVVAGFYFFARGTSDLQKSREGLLRAILYRILSKKTELIPEVLGPKCDSVNVTPSTGATISWTWIELKSALNTLLAVKPDKLGVYLFADGLDEYSSSEYLKQLKAVDHPDDLGLFFTEKSNGYNEIAELFQNISRYPSVKVCVSGRPLPAFIDTFHGCPQMKLEELSRRDITEYVKDRFHNSRHLEQHLREAPLLFDHIVFKIVDKAMGVFLWVKLVIDMVLIGIQNGDYIHKIEERINETPPELGGPDGLYMSMVKSIPAEYRQEGYHLFQVVRHARQGISPLALSFAEEGLDTTLNAKVERLSSHDMSSRAQTMEMRLRSRCAGLLEVQGRPDRTSSSDVEEANTNAPVFSVAQLNELLGISKSKKHSLCQDSSMSRIRFGPDYHYNCVVQFFHQTVKEFLEDKAVQAKLQSLLNTGHLFNPHVALLQSCILRLKLIGIDEPHGGVKSDDLWAAISDALVHAEKAERTTGNSQTPLIDELDSTVTQIFQKPWPPTTNPPMTEERYKDAMPHWSFLKPHQPGNSDLRWKDNMLSLAVQANLSLYLDEKLSDPNYQPKTGKPLLAYAILPQRNMVMNTQILDTFYINGVGVVHSNLTTVKVLLDHGEDPNKTYGSETLWEAMLERWVQNRAFFNNPESSQGLDLLAMLLSVGADPNAPVFVTTPMSRMRECFSPLYAVAMLVGGQPSRRLDIANELILRGGHLFPGERRKLLGTWVEDSAADWPDGSPYSQDRKGQEKMPASSAEPFRTSYFGTLSGKLSQAIEYLRK